MSFATINPATGILVREYPEMSNAEVVSIIDSTQFCLQEWQQKTYAERAALMRKVGSILLERKLELAALMTEEMGKTYKSGQGEIEKCAWVCNYYADNTEKFLAPQMVQTEARISKVVFRPLGIVLAVMPWNFPYWQVFRFAAPALMAGNGCLLKHAPNVCGSALAIEQMFRDAGFPKDIFRTLLIDIEETARVIEDSRIKAVTLTGSTRAGRSVGAKAGAMLKKSVLELGGSDPYLVLADADMDACVAACVTSRLINAGQSCVAAKRFIVDQKVLEEFTTKFVARMAAVKTGDPMDPTTDLGPQARFDLREELHRQVRKSVDKGAKLLLGGVIPPGEGAYYFPTVLTNVTPGMPAYNEELFGPVAAIISALDTEDAIRIANDSRFGLGGAVFTKDLALGEEIATNRIRSGACFVNDYVKSDPRLPFGGIGASGYGRELSDYGMKEFVNVKTVCVA